MGDKYQFETKCAFCGYEQMAYYAPSSGFTSYACEKCGKKNNIQLSLNSVKPKREDSE